MAVTILRRCRMQTDERRRQLLRTGVELLGQRSHDEVSIDEIARAAGISKGLLYHYFPTKKDFVLAVLREAMGELSELTAPDPSLGPMEQLDASLDAFLDYVEHHAPAYATIFRTRGGGDADIQATLEEGRRQRIEAVLHGVGAWSSEPAAARRSPALESAVRRSPALESAIQGWTFFVEGAVLKWLEGRELERQQLHELLRLALLGSLRAAQELDPALELRLPQLLDAPVAPS